MIEGKKEGNQGDKDGHTTAGDKQVEINNKEGHDHAPTADETSKEDDEQPLTGGTK